MGEEPPRFAAGAGTYLLNAVGAHPPCLQNSSVGFAQVEPTFRPRGYVGGQARVSKAVGNVVAHFVATRPNRGSQRDEDVFDANAAGLGARNGLSGNFGNGTPPPCVHRSDPGLRNARKKQRHAIRGPHPQRPHRVSCQSVTGDGRLSHSIARNPDDLGAVNLPGRAQNIGGWRQSARTKTRNHIGQQGLPAPRGHLAGPGRKKKKLG